MPELDEELAELRDDLRTAIRRPDLGQVATLSRQQNIRRNVQIGAIVAIVLVSLVVPVLRSLPSNPVATPHHYDYEVDFGDVDHGYALGTDCDSRNGPCSFTLLASSDGGRSWHERTLPKTGGDYRGASLEVLGPNRLVFTPHPANAGAIAGLYVSEDAGRTWREFVLRAGGAAGVIPSGTVVMQFCVQPPRIPGCTSGLGVMTPDKNELTPAPTQPPLVQPLQPGTVQTAGGRYWAAGKHATSGQWAVAVTSDAGLTWATTQLDVPGTPSSATGDAWSMVEQGGVMYATVRGAIGDGPSGLLAVFRSTDHGVSWTRTWYATEEKGLPGVTGSPIATTDGRLIVCSPAQGAFESTDGGRTFTRSSLKPRGQVTWTRGGYLVSGPENSWDISRDGVDWRTFTLP
jgi:hypothetical protein